MPFARPNPSAVAYNNRVPFKLAGAPALVVRMKITFADGQASSQLC